MERIQTNHVGNDLQDLVRRVRRKSDAAFDDLYNLVLQIAGPRYRRRVATSQVEDRLHDTFLIVLEAVSTGALREPAALPGFIQTVLHYQAVASIREVGRRRQEVDFADCGLVKDKRSNPEELHAKSEKRQLLSLSMDYLPERDRELLTRFYLEGQRRTQICRQMNLSSTQFRLNKWRAKERLIQTANRILAMPSPSDRRSA
jgi:RNA polymerase sigma factor (sigma-70 family)